MLRNLSYLNLVFAVLYFLAYLQEGNRWIIAGLLLTVVFNWMVLRNIEVGITGWTAVHYILGAVTALFGVFMGYTAIQLTLSMMAYSNYPWITLRLVASGSIFALTIFLQLFMSLPQNSFKKM